LRTISVTRLGVSVEKVVATIETPRSHHGIRRPERKKSAELRLARLETTIPITSEIAKNSNIITQSIAFRAIFILE
jgi:hypothetical protein